MQAPGNPHPVQRQATRGRGGYDVSLAQARREAFRVIGR
jgi:hypothetical protein